MRNQGNWFLQTTAIKKHPINPPLFQEINGHKTPSTLILNQSFSKRNNSLKCSQTAGSLPAGNQPVSRCLRDTPASRPLAWAFLEIRSAAWPGNLLWGATNFSSYKQLQKTLTEGLHSSVFTPHNTPSRGKFGNNCCSCLQHSKETLWMKKYSHSIYILISIYHFLKYQATKFPFRKQHSSKQSHNFYPTDKYKGYGRHGDFWEGGKSKHTAERPDRHTSARCQRQHQQWCVTLMVLNPVVFLPQTHTSRLIVRKTPDKLQLMDIL